MHIIKPCTTKPTTIHTPTAARNPEHLPSRPNQSNSFGIVDCTLSLERAAKKQHHCCVEDQGNDSIDGVRKGDVMGGDVAKR